MTTSRAISIAPSGPGVTSTLGAGSVALGVRSGFGSSVGAGSSVGVGVATGSSVAAGSSVGSAEAGGEPAASLGLSLASGGSADSSGDWPGSPEAGDSPASGDGVTSGAAVAVVAESSEDAGPVGGFGPGVAFASGCFLSGTTKMELDPEPLSTTTSWRRSGETMASRSPFEPMLATWVTSSTFDSPQLFAATGHSWSRCRLRSSSDPSSAWLRTWISPATRSIGVASGSSPLVVLPGSGRAPSSSVPPSATATTRAATRGTYPAKPRRRPASAGWRRPGWASIAAAVRAQRSRGGTGWS